jgi:hypothetical protein
MTLDLFAGWEMLWRVSATTVCRLLRENFRFDVG